MKTKSILSAATLRPLALLILLVAIGCVPSLHPLYTEKEVVFEPKLAGTWAGDNSEETWQFVADKPNKSYRLILRDGKKLEGEFVAKLVQLGPEKFLDIFPEDKPLEELPRGDFYKGHLLPAHTFIRIDQIGTSLVMAAFNADWLAKLLENDPKAIQHTWLAAGGNRQLVLTAETPELQTFFRKHAHTPDAFGDPTTLHRAETHAAARGAGKNG